MATEFINICETYAPIKHICVKNRNNPWMSNYIQQLIYTRDSLHEKAIKPVMLPSGISIEKLEILLLALLDFEKRVICRKKY